MTTSKQEPTALSQASLRELSTSLTPRDASPAAASSNSSSLSSQASSFWRPVRDRRLSSIDSYSSHDDSVRIRSGPIVRRVQRPSVSSNFSFPGTPERSRSPVDEVKYTSQRAFVTSLGIDSRHGPLIILMRHCQAECNAFAQRNGVDISPEDKAKQRDSPLSDLGKIQASKLKDTFSGLIANIRRAGGKVLISHLLRAKQTAFLGFPELLDSCKDLVEIRPELQELNPGLAHIGKTPQEQELEYPGFDYGRCAPEVNVKQGIYAKKAGAIRANAVLKKLKQRPEPILLLITHYHLMDELLDNTHWTRQYGHGPYWHPNGEVTVCNGEATVFAFKDRSTKLHPVSKKYADRILGKPASASSKDG